MKTTADVNDSTDDADETQRMNRNPMSETRGHLQVWDSHDGNRQGEDLRRPQRPSSRRQHEDADDPLVNRRPRELNSATTVE
jgi:hypothetical protein